MKWKQRLLSRQKWQHQTADWSPDKGWSSPAARCQAMWSNVRRLLVVSVPLAQAFQSRLCSTHTFQVTWEKREGGTPGFFFSSWKDCGILVIFSCFPIARGPRYDRRLCDYAQGRAERFFSGCGCPSAKSFSVWCPGLLNWHAKKDILAHL